MSLSKLHFAVLIIIIRQHLLAAERYQSDKTHMQLLRIVDLQCCCGSYSNAICYPRVPQLLDCLQTNGANKLLT